MFRDLISYYFMLRVGFALQNHFMEIRSHSMFCLFFILLPLLVLQSNFQDYHSKFCSVMKNSPLLVGFRLGPVLQSIHLNFHCHWH